MPSPLRSLFHYLPPAGVPPSALQPGVRLRAPFGRRQVLGVLLLEVDQAGDFPIQRASGNQTHHRRDA